MLRFPKKYDNNRVRTIIFEREPEMAKVLKVKREAVVKLFEHLGFKTAGKWDTKRLVAKIKNLPELTDGVKIRNPKVKKALVAILAADKIVIKTDEDEQPEKKSSKVSKKVVKKVKKTVKKTVKKKATSKKDSNEVTKDDFGCRLGTQSALINAALEKKGRTLEAIAKTTKLSAARVRSHLRTFTKKGFVKEDNKGRFVRSGKSV